MGRCPQRTQQPTMRPAWHPELQPSHRNTSGRVTTLSHRSLRTSLHLRRTRPILPPPPRPPQEQPQGQSSAGLALLRHPLLHLLLLMSTAARLPSPLTAQHSAVGWGRSTAPAGVPGTWRAAHRPEVSAVSAAAHRPPPPPPPPPPRPHQRRRCWRQRWSAPVPPTLSDSGASQSHSSRGWAAVCPGPVPAPPQRGAWQRRLRLQAAPLQPAAVVVLALVCLQWTWS